MTLAALLCWWLLEQLTSNLMANWLTNGHRHQGDAFLRTVGHWALLVSTGTALAALVGLGLFSVAGFGAFPIYCRKCLPLTTGSEVAPC